MRSLCVTRHRTFPARILTRDEQKKTGIIARSSYHYSCTLLQSPSPNAPRHPHRKKRLRGGNLAMVSPWGVRRWWFRLEFFRPWKLSTKSIAASRDARVLHVTRAENVSLSPVLFVFVREKESHPIRCTNSRRGLTYECYLDVNTRVARRETKGLRLDSRRLFENNTYKCSVVKKLRSNTLHTPPPYMYE